MAIKRIGILHVRVVEMELAIVCVSRVRGDSGDIYGTPTTVCASFRTGAVRLLSEVIWPHTPSLLPNAVLFG
jgi:hypothetical protein